MRQRRPAGRFFVLRLLAVAAIIALAAPMGLKEMAKVNPFDPTGRTALIREATTPRLPNGRLIHILYGDKTGGGHLHGMNKPCKSEFPADWSEQDIAASVKLIAANDALAWRQGRNGNYATDYVSHGVKIRVVLTPDRSEIVTAYPLSTPRNPCPAANDNNRDGP